MVLLVDYGVGNLASIQNMLKRIGVASLISSSPADLAAADKLILPGVGAFDTCVHKLKDSGLLETLTHKVLQQKTPVLGLCVGMQLLMEKSEEGSLPGLGWIQGSVVKFKSEQFKGNLKVPHMGWADVTVGKPSKLFTDMYEEPRFYFVHSYHLEGIEPSDRLVTADYGYTFVAGIEHENILGVQFHPEKSHKFGMKLLENFITYY